MQETSLPLPTKTLPNPPSGGKYPLAMLEEGNLKEIAARVSSVVEAAEPPRYELQIKGRKKNAGADEPMEAEEEAVDDMIEGLDEHAASEARHEAERPSAPAFTPRPKVKPSSAKKAAKGHGKRKAARDEGQDREQHGEGDSDRLEGGASVRDEAAAASDNLELKPKKQRRDQQVAGMDRQLEELEEAEEADNGADDDEAAMAPKPKSKPKSKAAPPCDGNAEDPDEWVQYPRVPVEPPPHITGNHIYSSAYRVALTRTGSKEEAQREGRRISAQFRVHGVVEKGSVGAFRTPRAKGADATQAE